MENSSRIILAYLLKMPHTIPLKFQKHVGSKSTSLWKFDEKIAGKSKLLTWCPTKLCSRTSVGSRKNPWIWQNQVHISNTTQLLELNSIPFQQACFSIHHGPSCIGHGPSHLHQFGYLHCSWCIRFGNSTSREWNKVTPCIRGRARARKSNLLKNWGCTKLDMWEKMWCSPRPCG